MIMSLLHLFQVILVLLVALVVVSLGLPFLLAVLTILRQQWQLGQKRAQVSLSSSLLVGRVWHTRHQPTRHAFTYPLFMFRLYLSHYESNNNDTHHHHHPNVVVKSAAKEEEKAVAEAHESLTFLFRDRLWPLSLIMNFSNNDHLINGEGRRKQQILSSKSKTQTNKEEEQEEQDEEGLGQRICNLVAERTLQKFQPTLETHHIYLVTHLTYYGYCFNPVSFYYVVHKHQPCKTDAIVAEVSNTPWLEMYCYVLHPDSVDQVQVRQQQEQSTNYVFPKKFHVSPFMEMNYDYDWILNDFDLKTCRVVTAMKGGADRQTLQFSATMNLKAQGLRPLTLAWQLARYPVYCLIIQIWIHYQAFWLFLKGVAFQPHPHGAETTASRIIGDIMTPLFALKDYLVHDAKNSKTNDTRKEKAT